MPFVETPSLKIHYRDQGKEDGPTVVLISGMSATLDSWGLQLPALVDVYRVITFDNRGAGETDTPSGPYSIDEMARDTLALMDNLDLTPSHVVGVSMGGRIALEIALQRPSRLKSLTLTASAPSLHPRSALLYEVWEEMKKRDWPRHLQLKNTLPLIFGPSFFRHTEAVQTTLEAALQNPSPQSLSAFQSQLAAVRNHDARNQLGEIQVPTLVIAGREDHLTPLEQSQELAENIPDADLVVIEGTGHGVQVEAHQTYNQTVLDFLGEQEEKSR